MTGSSIKRAEAETISVIQTLTRKDIEQTGKASIADVVRSISADNNGSISGSFTSGFAGSASGVSLRGLSVSSTLVLINGRRTAPYGFGDDGQRSFVDLNSIPLDAVDRIDILKDGASAIYGSDAIAGVVNIILRQNYVGKTISANVGQSGHGDGTVTSISGAIGFGDMDTDKFNVFATIDAKKSGEIKQSNRDKWIGQADARPWGGRDQRGGATTSGNGGGSSFLGTLRPISPKLGNVTNLPGSCDPINLDPTGGTAGDNRGGGCLWDPVQFATVQPKTENVNLFMRGTLALGADAQGYTEVGIFKSKADTYTTPSGLTGAGFDLVNARVNNTNSGPDQLLMPAGHPDNILGVAARPRWVDASRPRVSNLETTVTRVLAGVKGTYANWDYDTGLMYAESKTDRTQTGYYRTSALRQALNNGTFRIGKGVINSPEVLALVSPTLNNSGTTKSTSLDFKATRELFQLPGGMMGLAVGAEYRKEETNSQSTPYTDINDIVGLGYSASQGSRNVKALYAEVAAPVMKELELQFALRSDDYSDYGRSTTPKVGFKFTPASAVAFRGTYAEGFRAPSAAENGNSAVAAFTNIASDPVRCAVTHLTIDCSSQQVGAITIGNKNIKPETSKSYSLGMVLEPIKNISLSIDWWKIVRDGEINGSDPGAVVANPAGYPDAVIVRGEPTSNFPGLAGPILMVKAPYLNAGKTKTSGIDLDLRGKYNAGEYGRFNSGVTVTYMKEFTRTNADGTVLEFAGTHGDTNLSGNGGTPKTKVRLTLGWDQGPVNITANMNYVSSISNKNDVKGDCLDIDANDVPYKNCRIASFTTTDLFAKWNVTKQWELTASISNLFDKMAPLDVQTYGRINYNPSLHQSGAVGRYFTLGGRYTF
ncbi:MULTISPECIES: TonB-dependent receptor [unclassified Janthinobacterium]|uniref:TonB-dependent receptor n=1 Tax=unclassified Janthinobacterium TaxID=2610881 RepID=UPI0025B12156|nr:MULTISPECIES: TonB-dependent receptor [unclassified Janthinobacterium]MDN2716914.1 TonB-dependent receptor [Janthinobacterium sp. SUN120]MDO8042519.1 TonB-dependent receptor [Janthinobacterium sp. SUN137]MDO8050140.1 TonB-dependent receptor [Janthinobacterium sp. SUN211]